MKLHAPCSRITCFTNLPIKSYTHALQHATSKQYYRDRGYSVDLVVTLLLTKVAKANSSEQKEANPDSQSH